jgi:alkylhydroperoxidase family enzyme
MARVPYLTSDNAPESVADTLRKLPSMHVYGLMAHAETAFRPWLRFAGTLLNDLALDPGLRELAILRVGQLQARYEWEQHVPVALTVGITREQIDALDRGDLAAFEPLPRAVLDFVTALVRDEMDDERYAAVAAHLDDRHLVELSLVTAHYLMLARMMTTLDIDPDPPIGPGHLLRG